MDAKSNRGELMKEIPKAHQRSYAFETYYYELVTHPSPVHFHYHQFVKAMEAAGKPYFNIPAEWTVLGEPIAAVFILRDNQYLFDHFRTQTEVIRRYDPELEYGPDGQTKKAPYSNE